MADETKNGKKGTMARYMLKFDLFSRQDNQIIQSL